MSDSEYFPSDENSNHESSDTESILSISEPTIIETLSEIEITDITEDIMYLIEEFIKNNIQSLSSPKFYDLITNDIVEIILLEWQEYGFVEDDEDIEFYDELREFIDQIIDFFVTSMGPRRSIQYTSIMPETAKNTMISQELINKIKALQNIPQPKQKTREWYEFRYGLLSASNLWKIFGSDAQRNNLIAEKCVPFESFQNKSQYMNTESAMHWGNKYEPVTVAVYEAMFGTKMAEFGCIRHPKYPFIGASPDGINIDPSNPALYGRMLEIKNVVNREITGIPKEEYWIQTQIQMETCNLDECDFMETRFLEYSDEDVFYEDDEHEYKGVILHFIERNLTKDSMPIYKYMPANIMGDITKESIDEWIIEERDIAKQEGLVLFNRIYWYLEEFSCVLIERNKEWFKSVAPKIEEFWKCIVEERNQQKKEIVVVKVYR
uniref:YqaJ viral recombinase domain-containing protein n=1 Tax=viral metagenome TaxID=1070528 RepID=A0A6C0D1H1_9ZZZZ